MRRLLPVITALAALWGCGGDDDGFTAQQFVGAVNQRGATLELGPELPSSRPDAQIYALAMLSPGEAESGVAKAGEEHAGGSLVVMEDDEAGLAEYERCEQAASLLCFRADNIVLLLEGEIGRTQLAALAAALQTIADETSG